LTSSSPYLTLATTCWDHFLCSWFHFLTHALLSFSSLSVFSRNVRSHHTSSPRLAILQDVAVLKSPDPTKFKLANPAFPGTPMWRPNAGERERARSTSTSKSNADARAELAAVEPASTTPSPAPLEGAVSVAPLVLLKGSQLSIPGTTSKFPSHAHSTPPGLVKAGWDTEVSVEA
jgi:hypothetical protein